ncbi:CPBP family intramembrane glutamic endopeptidase [Pseudoclostridium thermosuccinogenes]|uniref:CPBP family intramembrane glutamic endopeptidase n=1 Tax=Clostridium thermosuccinogenes TaxID=84032 RepID=UPI00193113B2|nr:CPBP family intramembrane glutamic endopeptidase [Pseudoclostridium thermosuccinogenes]
MKGIKEMKKPLLFALAMLPIAVAGGYFITSYQLNMYDQTTIDQILSQVGNTGNLIMISVMQTVLYACVLGFFGYFLSEKIGLMKPFRFEKSALLRTVLLSVIFGIVFSLDYWTFGRWIPELNISETTSAGLTLSGWLGAIFYGGIIEEVMMRLFLMSLLAWIGWKLFFRKKDAVPDGVIIAANILAALSFAAGHLPATVSFFGAITPLLLIRCFLLNGAFGLFFGRMYRKYGIQYAMLAHALLHIVSKTVWWIFA